MRFTNKKRTAPMPKWYAFILLNSGSAYCEYFGNALIRKSDRIDTEETELIKNPDNTIKIRIHELNKDRNLLFRMNSKGINIRIV